MQAAKILFEQDLRGTPASPLSLPCLANASAGYFAKWFPDEADRANQVVQQTFDFLTGDTASQSCAPSLAEGQTHRTAGWTWYKYWSFMEMGDSCAELSKLALILLGCKPQTASIERLFKEYAAQQTQARNRMSLSTLSKLASVKLTWDQRRHIIGGPSSRSTNRVMDPHERARVPAVAQRGVADAGRPDGDDEDDQVDAGNAVTSGEAGAMLQQWVHAVDTVVDAGCLVADDRRRAPPILLRFDFTVQAVPQTTEPLPMQDVPGYPQEIANRLSTFRAAKFPLRVLVGGTVGGRFFVDMHELMKE